VPAGTYADTLTNQADEVSSDFALIPWGEYGSVAEDQSVPYAVSAQDRFNGRPQLEFIHGVLSKAVCNTGIFINNGFGGMPRIERPALSRALSSLSIRSSRETTLPVADKSHHVFLPFFGGVDDRASLRFVLQLARNKNVSATIARFNWPSADHDDVAHAPEVNVAGSSDAELFEGKAVPSRTHAKTIEEASAHDLALISMLQASLPGELAGRVTFQEVNVTSGTALREALSLARRTVGQSPKNSGDIVAVGRRHARLDDSAAEDGADLRRTIGVVADQMVAASLKASTLVIQAGGRGLSW